MKLGPVTKPDKKNKAASKNLTMTSYQQIDIFPIYGQFGAIWTLDFERIFYKTYIFFNNNVLSYKNRKQN